MPGFLTHYLAGQAVQARLGDAVIIAPAHQQLFTLGAQGPDIFFYYAPGFLRARSRNVGSVIHEADFGPFFMHMARYTRQETLFAYLSGFLTHFAVDVAAHPFVNAHCAEENATSIQAAAHHRSYETALDVLMLARQTGQKPADICQWQLINAPAMQRQIAAIAFSKGVQAIYNRPLQPQDVYHAMGHMVRNTRLLASAGGRRKKIAAFIENALVGAPILSAMVHPQTITDGRDYLRLEEADNFPAIFDRAVAHAAELIRALHAYRGKEITRHELTARIGNYSLATGQPC